MVDTINELKQLVNKKMSNRKIDKQRETIINIILSAAYRLINEGKLDNIYRSEEEAKHAINTTLSALEIETALKLKYAEETKYEELPRVAVKWANIVTETENIFNVKFDKTNIGLYKDRSVICECGGACLFNSAVASRPTWYCPKCGASVGVHKGTNIPLGNPTSGDTSLKRIKIHEEIDRVVESGMERYHVYKLLAKKMGLNMEDTHAGKFNEKQCDEAIDILKSIKGKFNLK